MLFNPFTNRHPIEVIRSHAERPEIKIVLAEKPDLSHKQILKKLVMTSVNKKHENGRIYSTDKDGNYVSHTVSPYAKVFESNIEDGIKELATVLVHKGYLPISSCASHELTDRRFISLCFTSKAEAEEFMRKVAFIKIRSRKLEHLTVKLFPAEDYMNTSVNINKKGNIEDVKKTQIQKELVNEYLQILFMRTSEDWWLVQLEIMPDLERHTRWEMFKRWLYKKFLLERDTKKLVEGIENV